jgi:hypothetical protein
VIKPLVQILEVHRIRSAQERAQAGQNDAVKARKRLAKQLAPETREELEHVIAHAAAMVANPHLPKTGPIFVSSNRFERLRPFLLRRDRIVWRLLEAAVLPYSSQAA